MFWGEQDKSSIKVLGLAFCYFEKSHIFRRGIFAASTFVNARPRKLWQHSITVGIRGRQNFIIKPHSEKARGPCMNVKEIKVRCYGNIKMVGGGG